MSESLRIPSVWSLPLHMLRLAGRCLLPLVMWYSAGELVRFGLLVGATEMSHGSMPDLRRALTMLVFIIMVLANLLVMVGMFHSLRGALSEMRARRAEGGAREGLPDVAARVIVPFVVLYLSWGWHLDDVHAFVDVDLARQSAQYGYLGAFSDFATGEGRDTALGLVALSLQVSFAITVVAFVARFFLAAWYDRTQSRTAGLATAFAELAFFYFGVQVLWSRGNWLGSRVAHTWWDDLMAAAREHIPGWEAITGVIGTLWSYAWEALVLPGAWLTVAILMYGAYAEDATAVIRGTRIEDRATRAGREFAGRTHALTRRLASMFLGRWVHWVAWAHTVRLTLRAGLPLLGMFALCFAGLEVGEGYARRGLEYLAGTDHPYMFWNVLFIPIDFAVDLAKAVLTVCLLAATFDVAAGAERRRRAAAVSGGTAGTDPTPPSPPARSATPPARPGLPAVSGPS
ncbi:hypothetical protein Sru01_46600 [Sphaerisporangium rufum]|uniref:Uncharacterized protein n=1 Tax=Sphaerisporangium rufum TaxID=1381558 RepID=A0A919V345_9ACTN|nr:hypothetical protein [Sphaerisporangium rufum]GII79678.1 hypothetical protein Sru01_46600 [Sphaerisporangium rufum]